MLTDLLSRVNSIFKGEDVDVAGTEVAGKLPFKQYDQTRRSADRGSFCYAPSVNMLFAQDGTVKACCHNQEYSIGSYPQQNIKQMWMGEEAQKFRQLMQRNNLTQGCAICGDDLKMSAFSEIRARAFDEFPRHTGYPSMMEFLFTNTCNLECVMCKGEFSSLIRKNREHLPPIESPYNDKFIEQLDEFIPHLRETRFSGSGEAFMIDMNYLVWEKLLTLNPDCLIMIQTNGTFLNTRIKDMLNRGKFKIGVSLDSLNKETYESIRLNANFDRVMENIRYFKEYNDSKKAGFLIGTCVMRQNWRELPQFVEFANSLNAVLNLHKVNFPREYALDNLPASELTSMHQYLSGFDFTQDTPLQKRNRNHYKYFVSVIEAWMQAAKNKEDEAALIDQLQFTELLNHLENRLTVYLDDEFSQDEKRGLRLQQFMAKFNRVIASFPEITTREFLLRQACAEVPRTLLSSFEKNTVEVLAAHAKNLM